MATFSYTICAIVMNQDFIRQSSLATTGVYDSDFPVFGKMLPQQSGGSCAVGLNGRTDPYHADAFFPPRNVWWPICDVENAIAKGMAFASAPKKPELVKDVTELVGKRIMMPSFIAAPDHWHTPAAILKLPMAKRLC